MNPLTLDEAHNEINAIYRFYAEHAPGVTPLEVGVLGDLWAVADALHAEENDA